MNVLRFVAGVKLDLELVVVPRITGAAAFGALKGEEAAVVPRITGADVRGALKGEEAAVVPRITGADVRGALKAEGADVVPRITGAEVPEVLEAGVVGVSGADRPPLRAQYASISFCLLACLAAYSACLRAVLASRSALELARLASRRSRSCSLPLRPSGKLVLRCLASSALRAAAASAFIWACWVWKARTAALFLSIACRVFCETPGAVIWAVVQIFWAIPVPANKLPTF